METIQMHLSEKQNFFWIFLYIFSNPHQILNIFKNNDPHSLCISEIMDQARRR